MKNVFELRYDHTRNLGNYESEKIGVSVRVEDSENYLELIDQLRAEIIRGERGVTTKREEVKVEDTKTETVDRAAKASAKKEKKTPAKEVKTEEVSEAVAEEVQQEEAPKEEKKEPVKKTRASKATNYNRDDSIHRKEVGKLLDTHFVGWRKEKTRTEKGIEASASMAGKPFLDEDGKVLESFIEELKSKMK